jgi:uncharacterized repeat protein (TIGR01451 family)
MSDMTKNRKSPNKWLRVIILTALAIIGIGQWSLTSIPPKDESLFFTLGANKVFVTSDQIIEYTVLVTNYGEMSLHNVRVLVNLSEKNQYMSYSTTAEKDGNESMEVDDGWLGTGGFSFGTLNPGQNGNIKFRVRVCSVSEPVRQMRVKN